MNQAVSIDDRSWLASLSLSFEARTDKTILKNTIRKGPLGVQRAFYPEQNGCAHVYILHPPAGIVSGDTLDLTLNMGKNSHALITTPGAARFYRARNATPCAAEQTQNVTFHLENNATAEYLPMETLVYTKANAINRLNIHLKGNATYIGWEIICLGLPHIKQAFNDGFLRQSTTLFHDGKCIFHDRMALAANDVITSQKIALGGNHVVGNMLLFSGAIKEQKQTDELVALCRQAVTQFGRDLHIGVTQLQQVVIVRYLGDCSEQCRKIFSAIWQATRPFLLTQEATTPRIWFT